MQNTSGISVSELQKHIEFLQNSNQITEEKLQASEEKVKYLEFQLNELKRLIFGAKRERFISNAAVNQLTLPFEVEETPATENAPEQEKIAYTREKKKKENHPGRIDFPSHLPVVEIPIEPIESTEGLVCIGQEVTSELDYEPARLFVRKFTRNKYAKPDGEGILIGKLPSRPIEKGIPGPGLLSNIFVEKFVDHLPFYRQIERFKREGITIAASTIDSWTAQIADLIEPLYENLKRQVLGQGYLQVDETPIKVLDKNKKGTTHQGYYWVYNAPLQNAVFYDYRQGRGREGPAKLLENFKGYLQTDGYTVYDWFAKQPGIMDISVKLTPKSVILTPH